MATSVRLQPALLDRLSDDDPQQKVESRDRRVISLQRLRECVRRDLGWLLSAGHLQTLVDLDNYPEVKRSVLNYGVPDIAGMTLAGMQPRAIAQAFQEAIVQFEPRLLPDTVKVSLREASDSSDRNALLFEIEADLLLDQEVQPVLWQSEVDLESGIADVLESD